MKLIAKARNGETQKHPSRFRIVRLQSDTPLTFARGADLPADVVHYQWRSC